MVATKMTRILVSSLSKDKELLDGNLDIANLPIAEEAPRSEGHMEEEAGGCGRVDGDEEAEGGVPRGLLTAFLVGMGALGGPRLADDGHDGVDVHLAEDIDVLELLGGD